MLLPDAIFIICYFSLKKCYVHTVAVVHAEISCMCFSENSTAQQVFTATECAAFPGNPLDHKKNNKTTFAKFTLLGQRKVM